MVEHVSATKFNSAREMAPDPVFSDQTDTEILLSILETIKHHGDINSAALRLFGQKVAIETPLLENQSKRNRSDLENPELAQELARVKSLLRIMLRRQNMRGARFEDMDSTINYCRSQLLDKHHEEFHVLFLDQEFQMITDECLGVGGIDRVGVRIRDIMFKALQYSAKHLVLVHNHPSGKPEPSLADIFMTHDITKAGAFLDIFIADHLIIAREGEFSFRLHGLLDVC